MIKKIHFKEIKYFQQRAALSCATERIASKIRRKMGNGSVLMGTMLSSVTESIKLQFTHIKRSALKLTV